MIRLGVVSCAHLDWGERSGGVEAVRSQTRRRFFACLRIQLPLQPHHLHPCHIVQHNAIRCTLNDPIRRRRSEWSSICTTLKVQTTLTHSLTHSLTQPLTHSLTHSLLTYSHPLTHSSTQPLSHPPTHSLTLTHQPTHSTAHSLNNSPIQALIHLISSRSLALLQLQSQFEASRLLRLQHNTDNPLN